MQTWPRTVMPWPSGFAFLKTHALTYGRHRPEIALTHDMLVDFTGKIASIMACGRLHWENCSHDLLEMEGFGRHDLNQDISLVVDLNVALGNFFRKGSCRTWIDQGTSCEVFQNSNV